MCNCSKRKQPRMTVLSASPVVSNDWVEATYMGDSGRVYIEAFGRTWNLGIFETGDTITVPSSVVDGVRFTNA